MIPPSRCADLAHSFAVGQMESQDYAKKAFQWAKALRLLDPKIQLVSCGETGYADWDRVTLKKLAPVVDYHSIHSSSFATLPRLGIMMSGVQFTRKVKEIMT